jgi:hypothetical protein
LRVVTSLPVPSDKLRLDDEDRSTLNQATLSKKFA